MKECINRMKQLEKQLNLIPNSYEQGESDSSTSLYC